MEPASAKQRMQMPEEDLEPMELCNTLQTPLKKAEAAARYEPLTAETAPVMQKPPAPGMLLHPLTMVRSKPAVPSMLSQQASAHSSMRKETVKAHLQTSTVFHDGIVRDPDAGYRLPKLGARQRPKSADAVTRSGIHLSSGNYAAVTAAHIRAGTRNPCANDEAEVPATAQHRAFPMNLVAGNYMHACCPKGVRTGEDAVHYLSANQKQSRHNLFMYCNLRDPNSSTYNPYDLVVVDAQATDPEHFIISSSGVCHIRADDGGNTVAPLHTWASEVRLFRMLKQMTFYKKFFMVKAWVTWKLKHKEGKFARRARFLQNNHLMLNEWFGETMRELFMMSSSVTAGATGIWQRIGSGWHVANLPASLKKVFSENVVVSKESVASGAVNLPLRLSFIGHEGCTHTIKDFQRIRADMRDRVSQGMDSISVHCQHLLHVLATDVQQELEEAYPEELSRIPLHKTMFQRPNVRARCRARKLMVHKYTHLTPMQRYERAQAHSQMLPKALRLADFLVLGSMLDLSCTAVDLVVRQILPDMPQICHGEQRVAYKHGLWLVRGEIIPPSARPNVSTVLSLSPTEPDLCTHVSTVVREIVGVAAATARPLLEPYIIRHYNEHSGLGDSPPVQPPISDFQAVFKTICDVPALQASVVGLLAAQYQHVCGTESMKILTSIGDLYTFMESFDPDNYLREKPSSADVVTDMDIMRRWVADVQRLRPSLHHELLLFDFSELRNTILEQGKKALKGFTRLAREWLYDKSVGVRAVVVSVSEGIHTDAYPKTLEDFLIWVNKFGDHFGGDQGARKSVIQDSGSLAQLHKMLEQELNALKKSYQQEGGDAVGHTREVESIAAALDAYVALAGVIDAYDTRCTAAASFYHDCIPIMKAQVLDRARQQEQLLQEVVERTRGPEGLAKLHGNANEMWVTANSLNDELKGIHNTASSLQKTQELLARDQPGETTATPLIGQVEAAISFLDTRKKLWMEVAAWTRVQHAFSAATLLTRDVKLPLLENALSNLDAAILVWEEKPLATSALDMTGASEAEQALSHRLRKVHRAWQSAMHVLPKVVSATFPGRHRLLLKTELSGLRAALDDSKRSIDQVLCIGEPEETIPTTNTAYQPSASAIEQATNLEEKIADVTRHSKQACLHAVHVSSALTTAAERRRAGPASLLHLVGAGLPNVDPDTADQLQAVPLWRMLALLVFSGAAMAIFEKLFNAASEETKIKEALISLCTRISCMELHLSAKRKYGCLVLVNFAELLHAIEVGNAEMTSLLSNHTVRHHLQGEFASTQAALADFESALRLTDDTQTLWLELSRILSEASVRQLVAADMPAFTEVQTRWRVMQVAIADGAQSIAAACAHAGPLSHCAGIMPILKRVQDNLRRAVTAIRDVFPRFHLLSDTEIMSALAHARDPMRLSPGLLTTCFPQVVGLLTRTHTHDADKASIAADKDRLVITAVKGSHGDMMTLLEPVAADLSPLHEWLGHLEVAMCTSLRTHTATALLAAPNLDAKMWRTSFPQQAVYVADCCAFTFAAEQALLSASSGAKQHAVNTFSHMMAARVETLSQQIRTADHDQASSLRLLVVTGIAHRDVASTLVADGAMSPTDWSWQRHLRHYWHADAKDCHIRVGDARIAYGWEYSGGRISQESCLLAHCDRAVSMACAALRRDCGVAFFPADGEQFGVPVAYYGESMAQVCGRLIVHVGCTNTCTFLEITRILQGIVSLGAWGHFCGIDLLAPDILSFLSDSIRRIQGSISARAEYTNIANVEVSLRHQCIIRDPDALPFALLYSCSSACEPVATSGAASSFSVQEYLLHNTRRVVLMRTHSELLLESLLRKHGLRLAQEGANAAVTFIKFLLEQQPHAVGPRHEVLFHELLTWTQQWRGVVEDNDGMIVSREACSTVSGKLPRTSASFARQLIVDIYGDEEVAVRPVRPSLAAATLEEAIDEMNGPAPCPAWRASSHSTRAQIEKLASNDTLIDLCGQLRYLHQEAAVVLFRTLEDLLSNHACTLIVGPSSCGKTALWQLLLRSLQKAYMDANTDVALIPDDVLKAVHVHINSLSDKELFGSPDGRNLSSLGTPAMLSMMQPPEANLYAREIAAAASHGAEKLDGAGCQLLPQPTGHCWLIVDAPLHGGHADRLSPLLLGQPVWCADGTRTRVQRDQRLIWECVDLHQASPLTLSNVGVCVVNMPLINADRVVQDCLGQILAASSLIDQDSCSDVWDKVPAILQQVLRGIKEASSAFKHNEIDECWMLATGRNMASLAPSIMASCLTVWDAHSFQDHHSAQESIPVIELCIMFSVSWATRGANASLSLECSEQQLERILFDAFLSAGMQQIPSEGQLWESSVHPASSSWTTWAKHIVGAVSADGGSALVEANSQPAIDVAWHTLNHHQLPMSQGATTRWVSSGLSSSMQALVEGAMDVVRPTLLRGPGCSRLVVQVHDIHCAAATASSPATAPALEFLRAFIDTGGFFLPSTAQLCSAPDVQMLLYSVSTLIPPCKTTLRLRNKVFCVPLPDSSLEPSDDGLFTPLASSKLSAVCTDFMQSLRDSILQDYQPECSASDVCDFLTTSVKEIYSVCKSDAPKLLFDVSAMVRILKRVHADLATVPFDFIHTTQKVAKVKDNMPGSVLMGVFGNLMNHRTSEDLWDRQQETMQQLGADQEHSADEIRLEHVWVLLTGEVLREAARAAGGHKLQLLVESMGLMLGDKLKHLCKFYEAKAEQDAVDAIAASLNAMNKQPTSAGRGNIAGAMNLWQADEDGDVDEQGPAAFVRSRLLSGLTDDCVYEVGKLAATFGHIVTIDGPDPDKRIVLPLHPEILQALLLQMLKKAEEKQHFAWALSSRTALEVNLKLLQYMQECGSQPGEFLAASGTDSVAGIHAQLLPRAASCLRDLRIVCTVNWVIASLRRPFLIGCSIIAANSYTREIAYVAAMYLNAEVVPLWAAASNSSHKLDSNYVLRQILYAIAVTCTETKTVVLVASESVLEDAEQLVLLQHFVVHGGLAGGVCPQALLEAFQECEQDLVEILVAMELDHYAEQVFPGLSFKKLATGGSGEASLKVERTGDLAQDENNSVLYLLGRRHSFIRDIQNKIQKATQFIRVCLCIQPEHLQTAALVSPSLMRTAAVVRAPEHYPAVDEIACQHTILRDTQHLLRPWNDDAIAMDAETQAVTSSPAQLLQQTTHGTVSGLCFIEAVEDTGSTLPAFGRASRAMSTLQSTIVSAAPLAYTAVLANSCTKHVYTGKNLTPAQSIAMHMELQKCSKVLLEVYYDGAELLSGVNLSCGFYKLRLLLDIASAVHRKHRKLMRTQLGHVSHLLRISGAIRSTCAELRSELSVSSSKTSEQQAAVSDSRQQLAKLTARMELLRSAQDEIQSVLGTTKDAIADIKERAASEVETIRNRYKASVESVMQLAEKDIQELRTYVNPPATITHVLAAICTILGFPTDWESALMLLNHATVPFNTRITEFDISTVRSGRLAQLRAMTADDQLDPLRVRAVSRAAHSLVTWVHAVDSYGHVEDIRAREHRALRGELDQAATKQALLEENATEIHSLESTMTTLKQQLAAVTHDNILIDTSMSARKAQIKILEDIITALAPRVKGLRARVATLQQRLSTLLGDSILAAALAVFGGMLSWPVKLSAVKRWTASMSEHNMAHTPGYTLCDAMDVLEQRHVALPRSVILSESLRHAMYSVSLVRGLVFLVDPEGEALNLRKALHAQGSVHRWLDLRLDSADVIDDALGAAAADSMVAVEVADVAASEHLIWLLARRTMHLPAAAVARLFLHTRLEGPWPRLVQEHTVMISFRAELDTAREHVRSTLISAADQATEDSRRTELAAAASLQHECHDIQQALYQLAATLQSNCWMDPALSGAVLQRLQDWDAAEEQLKAVQGHLTTMGQTLASLDPFVGATDAMWHALRTLAERSAVFDIPLLHALRWWESVFRTCLRQAHSNLLKGDAAQKNKRGSGDGSSSSVIQPSVDSECDSEAESEPGEETQHSTDAGELDTVTNLQLPMDELHRSGNGALQGTSEDQQADSTPCSGTPAQSRNLLEFAARQLPEHEFCAALVQSIYLWFDQSSSRLLAAAFYMSLTAGKGLEQPAAVSLLCEMLSQCCPTLQLRTCTPVQDAVEAGRSSPDASSLAEEQVEAHSWLNSQLLGALGWLERHVQGFRGLHDHVTKDPVPFYKAAMHSEPFENLPLPCDRLGSFQRLLLALVLQPNATDCSLEWYSTNSMQRLWPSVMLTHPAPLDGGARIAQALQSAPSGCCPVLLHAHVPHAVVDVVHSLLSIHRSGTFLLNAPLSRTLQLLASEAKHTPRRVQTSLVVIFASQHLHASALMQEVSCAATDGNWVLFTCAHLRPDLIPGLVRLAIVLQEYSSTSPHFRLFMSCPSFSLPIIPLRSSMLSVMCGDDRQGRATSLLRAADSPIGFNIPLVPISPQTPLQFASGSPRVGMLAAGTEKERTSALSPPRLLLLQALAVRAAVAIAQVEDRMRSNSAHAAFLCTPLPLVTARDFVHALWCVYETVLLAPDSRAVRASELQAAIVQVAVELRHGPAVHCDVALTTLQDHLVAGAVSAMPTGIPARTFSELLSYVAAEADRHTVAEDAKVPVCHAWHSQQVLSAFLVGEYQQYHCSVSRIVRSTPWLSASADCAHLKRDLVRLQESIRLAWTNLHIQKAEHSNKDEDAASSSMHGHRTSLGQAANSPDGREWDSEGEEDRLNVAPPSLMTQLPRRSETGSLGWKQSQRFNTSSNGANQGGQGMDALDTRPHTTTAKDSIVVRPRLSTAASRRSHRAVSVGPATTRASCGAAGTHPAATSRDTSPQATLKITEQCVARNEAVRSERVNTEGSRTGAVSPVGPARRGSRYSTQQSNPRARQRSWNARNIAATTQHGGQSRELSGPGSVLDDAGSSSPEASASPSPSRRSLPYQDKDPLAIHGPQSRSSRTGTAAMGARFLADNEPSPDPAACPGSQEDEKVGAHDRQQKSAAGEQECDSQLNPSLCPRTRKPSMKSVTYQAQATEFDNKKLFASTSIHRRSESQRRNIQHKSRITTYEIVALALAELGEEVSRAIQCISILKVCADYGTDLPHPLNTLLEGLACTFAPPVWRLDSLQHIPQPGAANSPHSLFWRPYMWRSQLDSWLKGVTQQLGVLEKMAATAGLENLKSPDPGNTGWDLSALRRPQALAATAQRLFCQSQGVPLQSTTCSAALAVVSSDEVTSLGSENSVLFSVSPTAWQDNSEITTAALLREGDMFWHHQRGRSHGTGRCTVLVVTPIRAVKGICASSGTAKRGNADETDVTQPVDHLMVHRNGSIVRGMNFDGTTHEGAKRRSRYVPWAGLVSDWST